ncbi:hypothetical protein CCP3SC5AM1_2180003 [Gammaproteobacteria bacterium]
MNNTANGFGGRLSQTLVDLSQSSTSLVAAQREIQKFLGGVGEKFGLLDRTLVSAGQLFLEATEKLEASMANFFSSSLDHFSKNNTEVTTGLHQMNDQMLSRLEQQRTSLMEELSQWRSQSGISTQETLRDAVNPLSRAIGGLAERLSLMHDTQTALATQLRDSSQNIADRNEHSMGDLATVATGMRSALQEVCSTATCPLVIVKNAPLQTWQP